MDQYMANVDWQIPTNEIITYVNFDHIKEKIFTVYKS